MRIQGCKSFKLRAESEDSKHDAGKEALVDVPYRHGVKG